MLGVVSPDNVVHLSWWPINPVDVLAVVQELQVKLFGQRLLPQLLKEASVPAHTSRGAVQLSLVVSQPGCTIRHSLHHSLLCLLARAG